MAAEILAREGLLFVTDGSFIAPSILPRLLSFNHNAFQQRYFPILISTSGNKKHRLSLSFVYTVNIARLFLPPLFPQFLSSSSSSSRVSDITIVISFPSSTSLKRAICQKFGKVLEPKHSQLLRNTRRSSLEDGIAPFFPRSDYNRCSFQIGGDDSQGYRTRAFPSRFLAIKVPPIYLSFQSFFFFFFFHPPSLPSFFPLFPLRSFCRSTLGSSRTRADGEHDYRFPTASHEEGGGLAAPVK